jgi:hypothetical protein
MKQDEMGWTIPWRLYVSEYGVMVPLESSVPGTSTNPARTVGPALLSGQWTPPFPQGGWAPHY